MLILYNLSSLKEHLKNCLRAKWLNPQIVEDEINNSLHLQVMIDIVNQEKHGYPLTRSVRSGKNPVISEPREIFSSPYMEYRNGVMSYAKGAQFSIIATILDDKGTTIFDLDELVNECYNKWEDIAKKFGCI